MSVPGQSSNRPRTAMEIQEELFDNMSDVNWTRFTKEDYPYLKQKIAYAMFGPPSLEGDMVTLPNSLIGYTTRQQDSIRDVYKIIVSCAKFTPNEDILFSTVFVICMEPRENGWFNSMTDSAWFSLEIQTDTLMWSVPVFAVRRCHPVNYNSCREPCRIYIDNEARAYTSWNAYLLENNITKCRMLVPSDGMYKTISGKPEFKVVESPAFKLSNTVLRVADVGGTVASVGAVGALILGGPAVVAGAVFVGGVTGLYGIARSTAKLIDRAEHKQSINALTDPEARGCWLNIGISAAGMGAGAATKMLQETAAVGNAATKSGLLLQKTVDLLRISSVGLSGIGIFNGVTYCAYKYIRHDETPSTLELFQLSTSLLFFGNAVMSNRTASQIVTDAEARTINNYRSELRSNRHRKAFDKMTAETKRINGNVVKGIMHIDDRDNFFASIVRMNKEFNKNGVKISFSPDGRALLNGFQSVDPSQMYNIGPTDRVNIYSQLGAPPSTSGLRMVSNVTPTAVNSPNAAIKTSILANASDALRQLFPVVNTANATINIGHFIFRMSNFEECVPELKRKLQNFSSMVYTAIMRLAIKLIENLVDDFSEIFGITYSNREKISETVAFIITFIKSQIAHSPGASTDTGFLTCIRNIFKDGCIDEIYFEQMLILFKDSIKNKFQKLQNTTFVKCKHCAYDTMKNVTL